MYETSSLLAAAQAAQNDTNPAPHAPVQQNPVVPAAEASKLIEGMQPAAPTSTAAAQADTPARKVPKTMMYETSSLLQAALAQEAAQAEKPAAGEAKAERKVPKTLMYDSASLLAAAEAAQSVSSAPPQPVPEQSTQQQGFAPQSSLAPHSGRACIRPSRSGGSCTGQAGFAGSREQQAKSAQDNAL